MADQTFQNVINGELVDSASGETYDVIDPSTGEVYAQAPMSGAEDLDRAYAAADAAFDGWGSATPQDRARALLRIADAIDDRADEIVRVESQDTGKPLGLTASEELPPSSDHFRFFAGAARLLEGKSAGEYMEDHTSFVRREPIGVVGQVTPVELPADDDDLEDRAGARGRQHHRPQAERHHPGELDAAGRAVPEFLPPGVLNVVCGDRDTGRRLVEHQTPQMVSITGLGAGRHGGRRVRRGRPQAGPPRARRQGAGDRLRRRRHREGCGRDRRGRLLQRRPGLHRRHPGARRSRRPQRLRGRPHRAGQGHPHRDARRRGRALRRAQQREPAGPGDRHGRPAARPRRTSRPVASARARPATSTSRPCCPGSSRTTSRSRTRSSAR